MLLIKLDVEMEKDETREERKELIIWSEGSIEDYKNWLGKAGPAENWKGLKVRIKNALTVKKITLENDPLKQSWWDKDSHDMKQELKEEKINSTRDGSKINGFLIIRKKYRLLIGKKKEEQEIQKWTEERKNKTGREFWELINKQSSRREIISKKIKMEEWTRHI